MNVTLNHGVPTNETSGDCDAYAHKDLYTYTVRRKNNSGDVDTKKYILHCGCVIGSRVITIDVRVELVDASKNLFLLRDNAPARHAAAVTAFLESKQLKMLPHPPCSPDLAPFNYFSSLRLRITTKGRRYDDGVQDIRKAATSFLEQTSEKDAQRSFGASVGRADRCIATRGTCFE